MQSNPNHSLLEGVKRLGAVIWILTIGMLWDVAQALYHIIRCEVIADDWNWGAYETEIGESTYEFHRCERCNYKRRVPAAYFEP